MGVRLVLRRAFLSIASVAVVAGLSACGGGGGTDAGADATEAHAPAPKELKVVVGAKMLGLEPNGVTIEEDFFVASLFGGTLTKYAEGDEVGKPELAQSLVESKDGLQWIVKLRPGLKFSDGSPLTATDVEATFEHILSDETAFQSLYVPTLKSVKAEGPTTVLFNLEAPSPVLPALLSAPDFMILPAKGLAEGEKFFQNPISAGPYQIDSWTPQHAEFSVNPNYYGQKPESSKVTISVTEDPGTRLSEVKTGEANLAFDLPANLIPQFTDGAELQIANLPGSTILMSTTTLRCCPILKFGERSAMPSTGRH